MNTHNPTLIPSFQHATPHIQRDVALEAFKDLFGLDLRIFPRHPQRPNDVFFVIGDKALWIPNATGKQTSSSLIHMAICPADDMNIQYPETYFAIGYSTDKKWSYGKNEQVVIGLLQECNTETLKTEVSSWLRACPAFAQAFGNISKVSSEVTEDSVLKVKVASSNVSRKRAKHSCYPLT